MSDSKIQSTGSYNGVDEIFSLTFCPNESHAITFDGLTIADMKDIKSLVDILLEEYESNY